MLTSEGPALVSADIQDRPMELYLQQDKARSGTNAARTDDGPLATS